MIFHNLFTLKAHKYKNDLCHLVLRAIEDEQLEVRLEASKTLSGLVHYGYFVVDDSLRQRFSQMAKTRLAKRKRGEAASQVDANPNGYSLRQRHSGVLGMSACILAFPYEVPEWMPQMLLEVGEHLHDGNYIQVCHEY